MANPSVDFSVFDLFCIGIGPSSSHTVGPMRAAYRFVDALQKAGILTQTHILIADLYGSLALTGRGHWTDRAVLLGLSGNTPEGVDPDQVESIVNGIRQEQRLILLDGRQISYIEDQHLIFHYNEILPEHPNGLRFRALGPEGELLLERYYFSVGGGTVYSKEELVQADQPVKTKSQLPYSFGSAATLLELARQQKMDIAALMLENEKTWRSEAEIYSGLKKIRDAMVACIERGCRNTGILPGGLKVKRRAHDISNKLKEKTKAGSDDPLIVMDWISVYALAVNEENAAGGRVVTAPTNGAAGVIPAVLYYYETFCKNANEQGVYTFLLTAAAIGTLYKKNASVSAAEVGCQGEIGAACSMAAGALVAALGGTNEQVENAAEIGMEHNLGLTCDPIGGLVQVPCIERNTMGAIKAVNAARLAMQDNGEHKVSLDKVIETMRQTGMDMQSKYKETSQGGLAVNVVEC